MIAVSDACRAIVLTLAEVSVKAAVLGLLAGFTLAIGRVRDPAVRHAVWSAVLCGMLGLPLLVLGSPKLELSLLPPADTASDSESLPTGGHRREPPGRRVDSLPQAGGATALGSFPTGVDRD